jgi:hypothetical protein
MISPLVGFCDQWNHTLIKGNARVHDEPRSIRTIRLKQKSACTQDMESDFIRPYERATSFATVEQIKKDVSSELNPSMVRQQTT